MSLSFSSLSASFWASFSFLSDSRFNFSASFWASLVFLASSFSLSRSAFLFSISALNATCFGVSFFIVGVEVDSVEADSEPGVEVTDPGVETMTADRLRLVPHFLVADGDGEALKILKYFHFAIDR